MSASNDFSMRNQQTLIAVARCGATFYRLLRWQGGHCGSRGDHFLKILSTFHRAATSLCVMNEFLPARTAVLSSAFLPICGILIALVMATGCSTFKRDWRRASATPAPANDVTGRWEGSWLSERNGHYGRLRCLMIRLNDRSYSARFKATYWKIFRFSHPVVLEVARDSQDRFNFQGQADLGWWAGGVYQYEGKANPVDFFSTYKSKYDHGTFRMKRP